MRKVFFIYITLAILAGIFFIPSIYAHPGNTASDGCHFCRTNCDKWGEVWDERHCHGGGSVPAERSLMKVVEQSVVEQPTQYPTRKPIIPTLKFTIKPTRTPTQTIALKTSKDTYQTDPIKNMNGFWGWLISIISNN